MNAFYNYYAEDMYGTHCTHVVVQFLACETIEHGLNERISVRQAQDKLFTSHAQILTEVAAQEIRK